MKKTLTLLAVISLVQSMTGLIAAQTYQKKVAQAVSLRVSRSSYFQGAAQSDRFRHIDSHTEGERGMIALDQLLRDLLNPFTVMCLAAHAEDIDFGTLAYYRKNLGARTVVLLATRNEGGGHREVAPVTNAQPDIAHALRAARLAGADVYLLGLRDFGHAKTAEEALKVWGRETTLARLTRAVRLIKPDCIITSHDADAGLGQHRALAQLMIEAFDAAGDEKLFPSPDAEVWQPRRLFQKSGAELTSVQIPLHQTDQMRGLTYAKINEQALKLIAAQSDWVRADVKEEDRRYYKLIRSRGEDRIRAGGSLTDGLTIAENIRRAIEPPRAGDSSIVEAINRRSQLIDALTEELIEKHTEGSVEEMRRRYGAEYFRVIQFTQKIERALALALGLNFEIEPSDRTVVPGQAFSLRMKLVNGGDQFLPVVFHTPQFFSPELKQVPSRSSDTLSASGDAILHHEVRYETPADALKKIPRDEKEIYFPIASAPPDTKVEDMFGSRLVAIVEVGIGQTTFLMTAQTSVFIEPAASISTLPFAFVKDWNTQRDIEMSLTLTNNTPDALAAALWVVPLALTEDDYEPAPINFSREGEMVTVRMRLRLPILKPPLSPDVLIELRRPRPAPPDAIASTKIAVYAGEFAVSDIKAAYLGSDFWLPFALAQLGVEHAPIDDTLTHVASGQPLRLCGELERFDTIILGERARVTPALSACLLEYARKGGNLVVFYQGEADLQSIAPFPIKISKEVVSSESALVKILDANHPLMTTPNRITEKDFEGWTGNRAVFPAVEWAAEYTTLIECSAESEETKKGGLLVARAGSGSFIYVSYDLGRQLLAPHAGAYRLFANLVSLSKTMKDQPSK
ncbi:MAG: PIG-L family deacetylase [Acidobacteriota bacterium]